MHLFLIGAGHVGLVTAVGLARLGHRLTVADIDTARIDGLRDGIPPVYEPGLEDAIRDALTAGRASLVVIRFYVRKR
jgi:UDPglucose 6-dehydrogenase